MTKKSEFPDIPLGLAVSYEDIERMKLNAAKFKIAFPQRVFRLDRSRFPMAWEDLSMLLCNDTVCRNYQDSMDEPDRCTAHHFFAGGQYYAYDCMHMRIHGKAFCFMCLCLRTCLYPGCCKFSLPRSGNCMCECRDHSSLPSSSSLCERGLPSISPMYDRRRPGSQGAVVSSRNRIERLDPIRDMGRPISRGFTGGGSGSLAEVESLEAIVVMERSGTRGFTDGRSIFRGFVMRSRLDVV